METLSKIQGSLMGVCLGDALGMPWEMYSAKEIGEIGVIGGFQDSPRRKIRDAQNLKLGDWTDDWMLTQAVSRSLIRSGGYDQTDQALAHIAYLEEADRGMGKTTRKSIEELKLYMDSRGRLGRSPNTWAAYGRGAGNGVAMKAAPIGLWLGVSERRTMREPDEIAFDIYELDNWIRCLGGLTHSDFRATVSGYAVASIVMDLMIFPDLFRSGQDVSDAKYLLDRTLKKVRRFEGDSDGSFYGYLKNLENYLFADIGVLVEKIGVGCVCWESVCMAIGVFLRHPNDFRAGMLECLVCGGDVDTICSMAGGMIGASVGIGGIPEEWINFSAEFQDAIVLGWELYEAAVK